MRLSQAWVGSWRSVASWKASPPQICACASEDKSLPLSDSTKSNGIVLCPLSWELFLPPKNGILLGFGLGFCVCSSGTQQRNGRRAAARNTLTQGGGHFTPLCLSIFPFPPRQSTCWCAIEQAQRWLQKEVASTEGIIWCFWLLKSFVKENLLLSTQAPNNLVPLAYSKKRNISPNPLLLPARPWPTNQIFSCHVWISAHLCLQTHREHNQMHCSKFCHLETVSWSFRDSLQSAVICVIIATSKPRAICSPNLHFNFHIRNTLRLCIQLAPHFNKDTLRFHF